jgi:4'-phosphopantetheinyl transferase
MPTGTLTEASVAGWLDLLDQEERERTGRFVFAQDRVTYVAAHALVRVALSRVCPRVVPDAWRFVAGANGKPVALMGNEPARLSFNLSHTRGLVGLAVVDQPGRAVGFDVEALDRRVTLDVADRYFCPEEVAWLNRLPLPERPGGFLRLWTLKEAFIKATGEGLARDLASFWFDPEGARINFHPTSSGDADGWRFEQRMVAGGFVAAVGLDGQDGIFEWDSVEAESLVPRPIAAPGKQPV